ncbi:MAG: MarR family transcriptional regulator [Candidatus Altiarchaeales archaeon]|nr:MarR family transcriptional regulator [Candidatus Altiarchaeales archaeon]MBD3416976.1 MarR family transcriptional regulator [Candidatus Altiarchaeales archaeon]
MGCYRTSLLLLRARISVSKNVTAFLKDNILYKLTIVNKVMMDYRDQNLVAFILVFITVLTLGTSLHHHETISMHYGPLALIFDPLIALTSFAIGVLVSLLFQVGISIVQFDRVSNLLPPKEKAVIELLFNRKSMSQADLTAESGLSRSMVSRILSKFEERGLIVKTSYDNTNLVESKLYRQHHSAQLVTKLPGISEKRLFLAISILFIFGLSFSVLNSYHILYLDHPLRPAMYLLAIEFLALGGLSSLLFRERISDTQFKRVLLMLPVDERSVMKTLHKRKKVTQKELVERTGIYKMKVSRILRKFQQRGLVDLRPYGYTNLVISKI